MLTGSESSVELVNVLSSQLHGYLANFLSDGFQFRVRFIQNDFGILDAL